MKNPDISAVYIDAQDLRPFRNTSVQVKEFPNMMGKGMTLVSNAFSKVLESYKTTSQANKRGRKKSLNPSHKVFEKFFSFSDIRPKNTETVHPHLIRSEEMGSSDDDLMPETSKSNVNNNNNNNTVKENPIEISRRPGASGRNAKIQVFDADPDIIADFEPPQFHHFPSFRGFSDILDDVENLASSNLIPNPNSTNNNNAHSTTSTSHNEEADSLISSNTHSKPPIPPLLHANSQSDRLPKLSPREFKLRQPSDNSLGMSGEWAALTGTLTSNLRAARSRWLKANAESTIPFDLLNLATLDSVETKSDPRDSLPQQNLHKLFGAFSAASQLSQQLTLEYRSLYKHFSSKFSAFLVGSQFQGDSNKLFTAELFDTPLFAPPLAVGNAGESGVPIAIAAARFKQLCSQTDLSFARGFLEQRQRLIVHFNNLLNSYTDQKSAVSIARAKLIELDSEEKSDQQKEEQLQIKVCSSLSSLHYQLLLLWHANISLQCLLTEILDLDQDLEDKQKRAINSENVKNQAIGDWLRKKVSNM
eukprot:TRINITY_DN10600_c0_g1_i2.p1 TRINITY_DN10600_c0_g1~~TRINITY_DN10600_c0_g1_i2.p1  ORF type:complete len:532 (+),score=99.44 TRINITY_DN10600_c0_g1_i2:145-1740(+)